RMQRRSHWVLLLVLLLFIPAVSNSQTPAGAVKELGLNWPSEWPTELIPPPSPASERECGILTGIDDRLPDDKIVRSLSEDNFVTVHKFAVACFDLVSATALKSLHPRPAAGQVRMMQAACAVMVRVANERQRRLN